MRKFLRIFFWSHGTLLGYLGSLSQKAVPEIFSKWVLINLSNPLRHPAPLVDPLVTKNLDTAGPWCEVVFPQCSRYLFNIRSQNSNPSRWVIGLLFWIKILYLPWLFTSGMATKVMQSRNIPGIDILQSEFLPSIKASKCHRSFKIDLFTLNF